MMEHLIASLLLPVLVLVMFSMMAGLNPDAIVRPLFGLIGVVCRGVFELAIALMKVLIETLLLASISKRLDVRFKNTVSRPEPKVQRVKVEVVGEGD